MPATTKHRRHLSLEGREFLWCVVEHEDLCNQEVRVISMDKQMIVRYVLQTYHPFVRVFGPPLPGECKVTANERYYACPRFDEGVATPGIVRQLMAWCLAAERPLTAVSWSGFPFA